MYTMSKVARGNVERTVGMSLDKIKTLSFQEEKEWVEKRRNERITFSKNRKKGIIGRGNALLSRRKIRTSDDLDKKSKLYIGI